MTTTLNINQIRRYLPHRYPFLLIDAVDDLVPGESITAHKCVSANEELFSGHFPNNPVMPGVLQIEAMCQSAALLALLSGAKLDEGASIFVTGVTDCRFRKPVIPGNVLRLETSILKHKLSVWKFACKAYVQDALVSEAVVTATMAKNPASDAIPDDLPKPPGYSSDH